MPVGRWRRFGDQDCAADPGARWKQSSCQLFRLTKLKPARHAQPCSSKGKAPIALKCTGLSKHSINAAGGRTYHQQGKGKGFDLEKDAGPILVILVSRPSTHLPVTLANMSHPLSLAARLSAVHISHWADSIKQFVANKSLQQHVLEVILHVAPGSKDTPLSLRKTASPQA